MDIVAESWKDYRQLLEDEKAPEVVIHWCHHSFDAGVEAYLRPDITPQEAWDAFHEQLFDLIYEHRKLIFRDNLFLSPRALTILVWRCEDAFKSGVEAQWMVTASVEDLKKRKKYYEGILRRSIQ